MAQLKDLLVTGASRLIGDAYTNTIQITSLKAPTSAGGSTYGAGTNGQVLLSNGSSIYWGSAAPTVTESTVSGWGFTKNTGTITGATANKGLTVSGTTLGHSNSVTAQNTQAIYPIKIDAQGHISAYGTAVTPLTASSTLDATKLSGTIPAACYTNTTYSAGTGISLSGTTFSNSGVRATTINGDYLRVNTNGTNADLTIPYATKAEQDANGFVFSSTYVKLVAGTSISASSSSHADLNALDWQKTGSYCISVSANVSYVDNMPSDYNTTLGGDQAFMMNVYSPLSSNGTTTSGNWIYRIQEIIPCNNHIYRWRRMNSTNGSGTWIFGAWTRQVLADTNTITTVTTSGSGNAITAISASNGAITATKGSTFLTSHQDISGKADKSATVSTLAWDSTNKKITKTINGTASDVVQFAAGSNVTLTGESGKLTIAATDTTYSSLAAANNGTAVSLVTTGEKYTWNNKLSSHQTIKQDGMTGATINRYGTCTTAGGTAQKDVTLISGGGTFSLETGATVRVKFTNYNSAENPTLKVGSTDAKPIMRYGTTTASTGTNASWFSGEIVTFIYDGTNWLMGDFALRENYNTIPSAYCTTAAATAAKVASCSGFVLQSKSFIHIIFSITNSAANPTLNINSTGAKPIYVDGAVATTTNLKAGSYLAYYNGTNYYIRTDGKLTADITGNAATATKATQDGSGNTITSTYVKKSEITKSSDVSITFSNSDTATVSVTGVTTSNTVIVSPTPDEWQNWGDYGIRCSAQASGSLTFTASGEIDLTTAANIVILS